MALPLVSLDLLPSSSFVKSLILDFIIHEALKVANNPSISWRQELYVLRVLGWVLAIAISGAAQMARFEMTCFL